MGGLISKYLAKVVGFDAVEKRDAGRDAVGVERKTDDELLKGHKSLELVATLRDQQRNTTWAPATALQLVLHTVGTTGGRLTVIGADKKIDERATSAFRKWAKHAEFTRGTHLNELLCQLLTQITHVGGEFIAVLDTGLLTSADSPSLRVAIFRKDQIKNVDAMEFNRLYPPNADGTNDYTQTDGIVRDAWGRVCGAFVGQSIKVSTYHAGQYIALALDTPGDFSSSDWIQVGDFPLNNAHGVSPVVSVANTVADISAIQGSEVQAAKINAALGIVVSTDGVSEAETGSHDFAGETDEIGAGCDAQNTDTPDTDAAENEALKEASARLREGNSAVVKLAANKKMESFKTDRPNLNVIEMYDRLSDECGAVLGLPKMFARLVVSGSYSGARTEMVLARPVFRKWQKFLERNFLDWIAVRVLAALGFNTADGVDGRLKWTWPEMEEVDEGSSQTALQKMFLNGEKNLIDIHGADTEAFLDRRAEEVEMFKSRGLVPPWEIMVNGVYLSEVDETAKEAASTDENKGGSK